MPGSSGTREGPPPLRSARFGVPIVLLVLLLAVLTGGLLQVAVNGQDRVARQASEDIVRAAGAAQRNDLESLVRDWSWWNEAVEALIFEFDPQWVQLNLTDWLTENFGVSRSFVFDPDLEPVHAAHEAEPIDRDHEAWRASGLVELVAAARDLPDVNTASLSAYIEFRDGIHLAAASKLLTDEHVADHPPYPDKGILILTRRIDEPLLDEIEEAFGLPEMALQATPPTSDQRTGLPLVDAAGDAVAWVAWAPPRPGRGMLAQIALPLGLGFAVILGLIALISARARRANEALRAAFDAQAEAQARLEYMARHDTLTDLANRALFLEHLETEIARAGRNGSGFAVHYLDLDRFKAVNDTHGHAAGDELLCAVAGRLTDVTRPADSVARFGGDEFAILQRDTESGEAARVLAERIIQAVTRPYTLGSHTVSVGVSVGIAYRVAGAGSEALLVRADRALYRAKGEGGSRYRFDDPHPEGA